MTPGGAPADDSYAATWGEEAADTLMELVTPPGHDPATKQDLEELRRDMREGFARVDERFDRFQERMEAMEHRLSALFERRISDAVSTQTRTLVWSQLAALVAISALAFGLR